MRRSNDTMMTVLERPQLPLSCSPEFSKESWPEFVDLTKLVFGGSCVRIERAHCDPLAKEVRTKRYRPCNEAGICGSAR